METCKYCEGKGIREVLVCNRCKGEGMFPTGKKWIIEDYIGLNEEADNERK